MKKNKIIILSLTTLIGVLLSVIISYSVFFRFFKKDSCYRKTILDITQNQPLHDKNLKKYKAILVSDKNNFDILVIDGDVVSEYILSAQEWEPHLQNILRQLIKPQDKVLIVGAHIGYHTLLISRLVGDNGKVSIFEPNPNTLKILRANIVLNDIHNTVLYPKAAFSENTTLSFVTPKKDSGQSHVKRPEDEQSPDLITVEAVKIDSLQEIDSIDILQMDVEGVEDKAVYGATKLIDNSPNLIVFQEWSPFWMKDTDTYLKFWRSRGYKIAQITTTELKEMTDTELKSSEQIDIILAKDLEKIIKNFCPL